ncbi:MAG: hypothetical protein AAF518_23035 [Spirochaetota bacterium]
MIATGIILQDGWLYFLGFILFLLVLGVFAILYDQFIKPYLRIKSAEIEPPPEEGEVFEFVIGETTRNASFAIGRSTGNLTTKCKSIAENHLLFQFKRGRDGEEYDIVVKKGGPTLAKPPRMAVYSRLDEPLKLESHEVIGKTADFRISDSIIKDRMTSYIEIQFVADFIVTSNGSEKMRFKFTISKIHPGMLFNDKRGILYSLGKSQTNTNETEEETTQEEELFS